MRIIITYALFALLCISSCKEDDPGDVIKEYKKISQHLSEYSHKTIDLTGITEIGGTMTGYFKDKSLKMVAVEVFADTGRNYTEFYFSDDNLLFVLREDFSYNRPYHYTEERARANNDTVWYDDKKTVMKTARYYFKDERMMKWVDERGRDISDDSREFAFEEKKMFSDAKRLQKMMKEAE